MKTFWTIIVVLCFVCVSFFAGRHTKQCPIPVERVDTLTVYDTIREPYPVEKEVIRYVTRTDIIPYYISDTVLVYVPVPIERIEYRDTSYYAIVEGYKAKLTYIETYNKTVYIDRVETHTLKTKPRWGIGMQAGLVFDAKNGNVAPGLSLGVTYNLFTW